MLLVLALWEADQICYRFAVKAGYYVSNARDNTVFFDNCVELQGSRLCYGSMHNLLYSATWMSQCMCL